MNQSIRLLAATLALAIGGPALLHAGDMAVPEQGKVAILENDRVLEGDIERIGEQYRIRRSVGETWLSCAKVRRLCASLEEAHVFLRSQANLNDPDECMRLARWCLAHGLRQQALTEATAVLELRPDHAEARRLLRGLERSASESGSPGQAREEPEAESSPAGPLACNAQALGPFVTRVQPILMNTCASCHAAGKGGSFKLIRTIEMGGFNRRNTQQNLQSVLTQLNRERPQESPLLKMALVVHGDGETPPLKGRAAPAYRLLEEWVFLAVADGARPLPAAPAATPVTASAATRETRRRGDTETRTFAEAGPHLGSVTMPVAGASWAAQYVPAGSGDPRRAPAGAAGSGDPRRAPAGAAWPGDQRPAPAGSGE